MKEKCKIPKFKSEADEAAWWYAHRDDTAQWMEEAATNGQPPRFPRCCSAHASGQARHQQCPSRSRRKISSARAG